MDLDAAETVKAATKEAEKNGILGHGLHREFPDAVHIAHGPQRRGPAQRDQTALMALSLQFRAAAVHLGIDLRIVEEVDATIVGDLHQLFCNRIGDLLAEREPRAQ